MNTLLFPGLLLFATVPSALLADHESDRKIEASARATYNYRILLDEGVLVHSSNGIATLSGKVRDAEEKSIATETVANLEGVTAVKDDLRIVPYYAEKSDPWIAWKVRSWLMVKANVSAARTIVTVTDGEVSLAGYVETASQKELTETYAREVAGVKTVKNELRVRHNPAGVAAMTEVIDDASITTLVNATLLRNDVTRPLSARVVTNSGVVELTGGAPGEDEKALVTKLTQGVRGVKVVTNQMIVGL